MPVSYSASQLQQIDAAKAKVTAAEKKLTDAQNQVNGYYGRMAAAFSEGSVSGGDCYNNKQSSLKDQLAIGTMSKTSCKWSFLNDDYDCPHCPDAVARFNQAYKDWTDAKASGGVLDQAQKALTQAIKERDDLISAIANTNAHDPAIIAANNEAIASIEAAARAVKIKWIFFGLAVVIILGAAIYFGGKLLKGTSAATN